MRKGFTAHRMSKSGKTTSYHVKATRIKDQGAPGRGTPIIPFRTAAEKKAKFGYERPLNDLAMMMGYERVTIVPDDQIDLYVRECVKTFGKQSVLGMFSSQVRVRRNDHRPIVVHERKKFEKMLDSLKKQNL